MTIEELYNRLGRCLEARTIDGQQEAFVYDDIGMCHPIVAVDPVTSNLDQLALSGACTLVGVKF